MSDQFPANKRNVPESKPTQWLGLGVVIVIVAVLAYVIKNSRQSAVHSTLTPVPTSIVEDQSQTLTVEAANFSFAPNTITVKKGTKVKIIFKSTDGTHDFVLNEFKVRTKLLQANQSQTVEFTASKTGSFEYYCSVGDHRQMGMRGTLIVE